MDEGERRNGREGEWDVSADGRKRLRAWLGGNGLENMGRREWAGKKKNMDWGESDSVSKEKVVLKIGQE